MTLIYPCRIRKSLPLCDTNSFFLCDFAAFFYAIVQRMTHQINRLYEDCFMPPMVTKSVSNNSSSSDSIQKNECYLGMRPLGLFFLYRCFTIHQQIPIISHLNLFKLPELLLEESYFSLFFHPRPPPKAA